MRTTIRMSEDLARRAKQFAERTNRTFTQVVEEAVTEFIAKPPSKEPRPRIVLPTSRTASGQKMTDAEYRALVEAMYDEEAERIWKAGHATPRR